jgi:hypothetical protein
LAFDADRFEQQPPDLDPIASLDLTKYCDTLGLTRFGCSRSASRRPADAEGAPCP